jgi:hypothetical protein
MIEQGIRQDFAVQHNRLVKFPATLAACHLTPSRLEMRSRNPPRISVAPRMIVG